MTRRLLLVSLAAGALTVPAPAYSAATELTIREINVRPADPVVGAGDSVRLLVDVIVKGARGRDGVTIKVEPGTPPKPPLAASPGPAPVTSAVSAPQVAWDRTRPDGRPAISMPPAERRPEPRPIQVTTPAVARLAAPPAPPASPVAGRMTDGWETWRFLPDKGLNRFYPAGTWTVTATAKGADGTTVTEYASFQLRRQTRLTAVRASRARGAESVRVEGSLTRVGPKGVVDYAPFAGQEVEILWRQDSTGAWQRAGVATTGERGDFGATVTGRSGGYWRARYPGTGHYAPALSSVQQISQ
ncbi:hypothetical protein [Nonomuraea sp. NPDC048916]|uniref:hypothetical protein n=1 Tax=Nonomuraea sp. NPDC048916 TaxID=3154232 RepID=UPI003409BE85